MKKCAFHDRNGELWGAGGHKMYENTQFLSLCFHTFYDKDVYVYTHFCGFLHTLCSTNPSPPRHLTVGLWLRSHLMYLQLIPSHNQCHCNQSCHSTQGSLSSFLTSQSHLTVVSFLSYLLSSLLAWLYKWIPTSFTFWQTDKTPPPPPPQLLLSYILLNNVALLCNPPHYHSPLSLLLFCILSYIFTLIPADLPSLQLWFSWHFPLLPVPFFLSFFINRCTHPHITIFSCPGATRNKPSNMSSVTKQKLHCVPVTSAHIFLYP